MLMTWVTGCRCSSETAGAGWGTLLKRLKRAESGTKEWGETKVKLGDFLNDFFDVNSWDANKQMQTVDISDYQWMEQLTIPEVTKPMDLYMDLYGGFLKWRTWRTPVNHWFPHGPMTKNLDHTCSRPRKSPFFGVLWPLSPSTKYCM